MTFVSSSAAAATAPSAPAGKTSRRACTTPPARSAMCSLWPLACDASPRPEARDLARGARVVADGVKVRGCADGDVVSTVGSRCPSNFKRSFGSARVPVAIEGARPPGPVSTSLMSAACIRRKPVRVALGLQKDAVQVVAEAPLEQVVGLVVSCVRAVIVVLARYRGRATTVLLAQCRWPALHRRVAVVRAHYVVFLAVHCGPVSITLCMRTSWGSVDARHAA